MRRNQRNADIKEYAKKNDVRLWMIAEVMHMTDQAFSVYLRRELTEEENLYIKTIIDSIAKEG